ncbi:MAG: HD domain-containing protein [Patescibacteria group bacterium]|nr:HD domain-containing protein [Patescibacteria group bacterium]
MTINDLLNKTSTYCNKDEQSLIKNAYLFADKIHRNVKRGTGEEYIKHPLEAALWLAKNHLGPKTIAAALLHDTLEDGPANVGQEIKKIFGSEVYELVEGVSNGLGS